MIRSSVRPVVSILHSNLRHIFGRITSPESSRNSYIILPEIANNSDNIRIDNIFAISPYESFIEYSRTLHNFENDLGLLSEKFKSLTTENLNFENTVLELEQLIQVVDSKFKVLKFRGLTRNDPSFQIIFNYLWKKTLMFNQEIVSTPTIGYTLNLLNNSDLSIYQQNYLRNLLQIFKFYGFGLSGAKFDSLQHNLKSLLEIQIKFNKSVYKSKSNAIHCFSENMMAENTPDWLLSKLRAPDSKNLLKIDLSDNNICSEFLKFCKDHKMRNQVWLVQRQFGGKILFDTKSSNYRNIVEIRTHCKVIAHILEQQSYCDLIINSNGRMANSLDEILNVLQHNKSYLMKNVEYEHKNVIDYAKTEKGLNDSLLLSDYDYIYHCFALDVKNCLWTKMQNYETVFDVKKIFQRIFFILEKLFTVTISELYNNKNHHLYEIFDRIENKIIGRVIILVNRNRDNGFVDVTNMTINNISFSLVTINLLTEEPNFMNCMEIISYIGIILDGLYNKTNFEISPLYPGRPPDVIGLTSKCLLDLFISSKHIFKYLFPELNIQLAEDLSSLYTSKSNFLLNDVTMLEKLSRAYFDLEVWLSNKDWQDVQSDIWSNFFSVFPFNNMDEWPCGATEIFSDKLWCGVRLYSFFWTANVAKSICECFATEKFFDWDLKEEINPRLLEKFVQFKKMFIEDSVSCKSKALNQFLMKK